MRPGASPTAIARLCSRLDELEKAGALSYWQRRAGMERPWLLVAPGFERAYTRKELEAFLEGAECARAAA